MENMQDKIKQLWTVEQDILDVIHEICLHHNLRYTLAYGTLIGAMRHGGFIPWDDDIDLIMPRDDYESFLSIWNDVAPQGYILQNKDTDPEYTNTFSKIRKDHTTFLQNKEEKNKCYHKGVFVDIFPADRVAHGRLARLLQYVACAVNLLYTRGYTSGSQGMIGMLERIFLALPGRMQCMLREKSSRIIQKWNTKEELMWFVPSTIEYAKHYYHSNLFDHLGTIRFCEKEYSCVADPDSFLRADYGNYMEFPPEKERVWKHHPLILDFEHNYEELEKHGQ